MSTQITVNINEPNIKEDASTVVVPNTGGISGFMKENDVAIPIASIVAVILMSTVFLFFLRHKNTRPSHRTKPIFKLRKHLSQTIISLTFLIAILATFTILKLNNNHFSVNAESTTSDDTSVLSITAEDVNIDLTIDDEAVYAMSESKVIVNSATTAGYTLMAYIDKDTIDLANITNEASTSKISGLSTEADQTLTDNTWGIALTKPEDENSSVFTGLPANPDGNLDNTFTIKSTGYAATEAEDETILYYGIYATPDLDYGTYTGVTINYIAVSNVDPVTVIYDANGLEFENGETTNKVFYTRNCSAMYQGTTPTIVKSSNLNEDGTQNSPYANDEYINELVSFYDAAKLKVVVSYGLTAGTSGADIARGSGGDIIRSASTPTATTQYVGLYSETENLSSQNEVYIFDDNSIQINMWSSGSPAEGYDYGIYVKVYPLYYDEIPDTEKSDVVGNCSLNAMSGAYAETVPWNGRWYIVTDNDETISFTDESSVITYLEQNSENFLGTTITLYAFRPYNITYNGNNATAGTMNGFYTTIETMTDTATLIAPNFYRTGYGFAGWSENSSATVNGSDIIYGPNEKITGSNLTFDSSTHEATLYAVWVPTAGTMQNWSGCFSLYVGQVTALTDSRDNNVYTVGRLVDGNCWMMENLRLDESAANINTDALSQNGSNFVISALPPSTNTFTTDYTDIQYNKNNTDISLTANYNDTDSSTYYSWYSYGNYYSWVAAIGRVTSAGSTDSITTSICPAGWHLPYGGMGTNPGRGETSGGLSYLDRQFGGTGLRQFTAIASDRWRKFPNNFVYSGQFVNSSAYGRGIHGYYWSATMTSNQRAYSLYFGSTLVNPSENYNSKDYGLTVRCVANS